MSPRSVCSHYITIKGNFRQRLYGISSLKGDQEREAKELQSYHREVVKLGHQSDITKNRTSFQNSQKDIKNTYKEALATLKELW